MQSLDKNGVSITQTLGKEELVECCLSVFKRQIFCQHDCRHTGMELFNTAIKTLVEYHRRRDGWIAKREQSNR